MPVRPELTLRLPNSPGALAGVCRALAEQRVNIVGLLLDPQGQLRLVVDNHVHALATLRERHHQVTERDVLFVRVPSSIGSLAAILALAADAGVNVDYAYATVAEGGAAASVILGVDDPQRAATAAGL
jgi:hypothetical protein